MPSSLSRRLHLNTCPQSKLHDAHEMKQLQARFQTRRTGSQHKLLARCKSVFYALQSWCSTYTCCCTGRIRIITSRTDWTYYGTNTSAFIELVLSHTPQTLKCASQHVHAFCVQLVMHPQEINKKFAIFNKLHLPIHVVEFVAPITVEYVPAEQAVRTRKWETVSNSAHRISTQLNTNEVNMLSCITIATSYHTHIPTQVDGFVALVAFE
jgi:hypothetical protein